MAKVVIDPGHGGTDSGAVGNGIIEKDLNLKISKYIYNRLKDLGVNTKITREEDETLTPTERVKRVLNAFGDNGDVLVISNHINAGGGDGAEVIYALRSKDTLPNLILNELSNEGQNIRRAYQRKLPNDNSKDYYFMQRNTGNTESITVEYGFLDSKGDDVNQLKTNWKNYAEAVVRAIIEYLNLTYIPVGESEYYTVKQGDTLWSIAKKYGITVLEIKEANGLVSSNIKLNQTLKIPIFSNKKSDNKYIVKKGDTLYKISKNYDVDINDIIKLNNLVNTTLQIGQTLEIPKSIENTYTVKKGDTLYKISKEKGITLSELMKLNNLINTTLQIGQVLKIK